MKRWTEPAVVGRKVALPKQPQPRFAFAGMRLRAATPARRVAIVPPRKEQ